MVCVFFAREEEEGIATVREEVCVCVSRAQVVVFCKRGYPNFFASSDGFMRFCSSFMNHMMMGLGKKVTKFLAVMVSHLFYNSYS